MFANFQILSSFKWVPELSPREIKRALALAIFLKAEVTLLANFTLAGSFSDQR